MLWAKHVGYILLANFVVKIIADINGINTTEFEGGANVSGCVLQEIVPLEDLLLTSRDYIARMHRLSKRKFAHYLNGFKRDIMRYLRSFTDEFAGRSLFNLLYSNRSAPVPGQ